MKGRRLFALAAHLFLAGWAACAPLPPVTPGGGAPSAGTGTAGEVRFLVLGDWGREGSPMQREVAGRMGALAEARGADFVIATGDNFYENGVRSVDDPRWQTSFHDVYTDPSLDIPWYAVLGNHDYRGSAEAQVERTLRDERWRMPARHHSFERKVGERAALFVFLDTTPFVGRYRSRAGRYPDLASTDPAGQLKWLEEVLGRSGAEWKIVVGHHPVFSGGALHGSTRELLDRLRPVLERHDVQVYFSGHDHNLQHLKPPGPTHYIVSGSGSRSRAAGSRQHTLFAAGVSGFVAAVLGDDELRIEFLDHRGKSLHAATIPFRDTSL